MSELNSTVSTGDKYVLKCSVSTVPSIIVQPTLEWFEPGGRLLINGSGTYLSASLNQVMTSNAGQYVCQATISITSIGVYLESMNSTTLTVQSEQN